MRDKIRALALTALLALLLCGCGRTQCVTVFDSGVTTTLELSLPLRVEEILRRAEITLREGDEVEPALDARMDEPGQITVRRECVVLLDVYGELRRAAAYGLTVGELLEREGVTLRPGQHVSVPLDSYLKNGMEIRVSDMVNVRITHDGVEETAAVAADTVGAALAERGIRLGLEDRVTPAADSPTGEGMHITVVRIRYEVTELTEPMPFETVYEKDETLPFDTEEVRIEGRDGLHRVKYRITYADGAEESREALAETVLEAPVDRVVHKGPKDLSVVSIVSRKAFYDCDGSGHGYYEIVYSDGTVEYERF